MLRIITTRTQAHLCEIDRATGLIERLCTYQTERAALDDAREIYGRLLPTSIVRGEPTFVAGVAL